MIIDLSQIKQFLPLTHLQHGTARAACWLNLELEQF